MLNFHMENILFAKTIYISLPNHKDQVIIPPMLRHLIIKFGTWLLVIQIIQGRVCRIYEHDGLTIVVTSGLCSEG